MNGGSHRPFWRIIIGPTALLGLGLAIAVITLVGESPPDGRELPWSARPTHSGWVAALAFSPRGDALTAVGFDGALSVCDVGTGRERAIACEHPGYVYRPALAPDASTLAGVTPEGTVIIQSLQANCATSTLWDTATGAIEAVLADRPMPGSSGPLLAAIQYVAFSPGGTRLVSVLIDGSATLWDVAVRRQREVLRGADYRVSSVAYSPDGGVVALGMIDGSITLWEPATRRERARLHGHSAVVSSLAFSPDGRVLASGDTDGRLRAWDVIRHRHS